MITYVAVLSSGIILMNPSLNGLRATIRDERRAHSAYAYKHGLRTRLVPLKVTVSDITDGQPARELRVFPAAFKEVVVIDD